MRYLIIALLLTSCGLSSTYRDNQARQNTKRYMLQCEEMGYNKGTEEFRQCVVQLHGQKLEIR